MIKIDEVPYEFPDHWKKFDPWEEFYRKWRIQRHGKKFEVRSYGLCRWYKVVFLLRGGQEFYRLERDMDTFWKKEDKDTSRKEYFQGQLKREYIGLQNCFIEFFEFLRQYRTFPSQEKFSLAGQALGLEEEVFNTYINFYQQVFAGNQR